MKKDNPHFELRISILKVLYAHFKEKIDEPFVIYLLEKPCNISYDELKWHLRYLADGKFIEFRSSEANLPAVKITFKGTTFVEKNL